MSAATNSTGEYLKLHIEVETEGSRSTTAPDAFDQAVDATMRAIAIGPDNTVEGIARLCAWFSTAEREVYARIECVDGKPVAYLVRGDDKHFPPAFLRRQAG